MSDVSEPAKKPKRIKGFAEKQIDWQNVNDVARRFALSLELLEVLNTHEVGADSKEEEDSAEALSVFIATAAYLMVSFAVSEKDACASFRRMFKVMKAAHVKLMKNSTKAPTAKEVFTEVALDVEE